VRKAHATIAINVLLRLIERLGAVAGWGSLQL
jgi:hypothetical protein